MFTLRRWWEQHGNKILMVTITLIIVWGLRQTQGAFILELYQMIANPLKTPNPQEERLINARVLELQQKLFETERQNQQLQSLLGYRQEQSPTGIAAPVIGRSADHWWHFVTLGRGSQQGVQPNSVVLGLGGLVGRVVSVTPNTSRVLLISDATSRVGVLITRTRHMGILRGLGSNQAVIQFFDKVPDVKPGDVVVTSSVSQLFSPGTPVGRVRSIDLDKTPAPEAIIEITAPINNLEWVIVAPQAPRPQTSAEQLQTNEEQLEPPQNP